MITCPHRMRKEKVGDHRDFYSSYGKTLKSLKIRINLNKAFATTIIFTLMFEAAE